MTTTDGQWGLYPWFEEHGPQWIHPDDLDAIRSLVPYGKVFRRCGNSGERIILSYGDQQFRVAAALFRPVPPLLYDIGDRVFFESQGRRREGTIAEISWHFRESGPFFQLRSDGKLLSKRYWREDLSPA